MEAIDRFDPVKGASFEQYAWTRVAGALVDELRKQDWALARFGARAAHRARHGTLLRAARAMPTEAELAHELEHDVETLRTSIEDIDRSDISSLNAPSPRRRGLAADGRSARRSRRPKASTT
jgi:RNA polymerase sigma factor for flagellar operon FliA